MSVFLHYEQGVPMTLLTVYDPVHADVSVGAPASRTNRGWLLRTAVRLAGAISAQTMVLYERPGGGY
ncbi:MAG TPA: hypothetical protein VGG24_16665 [Paraburkholderia sp.]|jgi:hypothetical protein